MSARRLVPAFAAAGLLAATAGRAQRLDYTPPELEGIEIEDRSGAAVPGDVLLRDEAGEVVRLDGFLGRGRPVVLQLVYFDCPMLCNLVINGFVKGAAELDWTPGGDYEVLSVSFNPRETPALAALKKANYIQALGRPEAAAGWHFLTGDEEQVRRLAGSVGFPYRWIEDRGEYAHGAGMFVLTPDGRISRTLYGIEFPARDLRFSLMEASEGRLGSPLQHLVLYCFRYNADSKGYVLAAVNVMKIGGGLAALALGTLVGALWLRERRHVARAA